MGFILGDVSGHGRGALARTAFMRYTLRAYLEAGLEPRVALQVAGRVIDENLGGDFATVLLAVHDPATGSLTYATAGHPAPIVIGPQPHEPVTAGSSPPIGVGIKTGLRQTTVPLVPGATAALFTDGLMEARVDGVMLGRERLEELLVGLGAKASARSLIDRVAQEAGKLSDDIAAVVVSPTVAAATAAVRTEQLELSRKEIEGDMAARFLASCGVPGARQRPLRRTTRGCSASASAERSCAWCSASRCGWRCSPATWRRSRPPPAAPPRASCPSHEPDDRLASPRRGGPPPGVPGIVELDGTGGGKQLPPLVQEHRLEHAVARAPHEQRGHVEARTGRRGSSR